MSQEYSFANPLNERSSENFLPRPIIFSPREGNSHSFRKLVHQPHCKLQYDTSIYFNDPSLSPLETTLGHFLIPIKVFLNLTQQVQMLIDMIKVIALHLPQLVWYRRTKK